MSLIVYIVIFVVLVVIFSAAYLQNKRNRVLSVKDLEKLKLSGDQVSSEELSKLCPVCGFSFFKQIGVKPWEDDVPSHEICPGCGVKFGYDDNIDDNRDQREEKYLILRQRFLKKGKTYENLLQKAYKDFEK